MRLSVVIVSYNVSAFLEQCLLSVQRALRGLESEIWVVDNASSDDSAAMVRRRFPEVNLVVNEQNVGFAAANNQALRYCRGEYVLLLNPDTLVEEDTFHHCLAFMNAHPEAGALGVRMLDGSGQYLPESKRGFPTPWVSFCKMTGLGLIFPRSARFNRYYLGHLSPKKIQQVEVLAGCFMFMRRSALEQAGLLDEAFFMYGEDIDLSYRLQKAGFQNYYYPHVRILHYKGESTQKDFRYVRRFYEAMIVFTRKHFQQSRAGLIVFLLQIAIALRAIAALAARAAHRVWLPLLDVVLMYGGLVVLKNFWAHYYYKDPDYFQPSILWFNFPLYVSVWLFALWLGGSYDQRYDLVRLLRNIGFGSLVLAAIYGFLDQAFRPSRAVLVLGAIWTAGSLSLLRVLLHFFEYRDWHVGQARRRNILIVGTAIESERAQQLLQRAEIAWELTLTLPPEQLERLPTLTRLFGVDEIIFCTQDVPISRMLDAMERLGPNLRYKTLPSGSNHIIGSNHKDRPGELYSSTPAFRLAKPEYRRLKRIFDLGACLLLLLICLLEFFRTTGEKKLLTQNWLPVFLGRKTWIGYAPTSSNSALPALPPAVFFSTSTTPSSECASLTEVELQRLNFLYAKNWTLGHDALLLYRALKNARA
ncbi:MAG: glycosyltransferase family 2 protein [Saprospiraceae bacterium]|nr:glycosyltransferase family 2 protein [Saprospiraceae bacterium]MDW8484863.1 glycosyltransferase family 2 protein [Saprospiraceae bacterium]